MAEIDVDVAVAGAEAAVVWNGCMVGAIGSGEEAAHEAAAAIS